MSLFSPVFKEMAKKYPPHHQLSQRWYVAYKKAERFEIATLALLAIIILLELLVYFSLDIPPTF